MDVELLHEPTARQPFDLALTLRCEQGQRWRSVDEFLHEYGEYLRVEDEMLGTLQSRVERVRQYLHDSALNLDDAEIRRQMVEEYNRDIERYPREREQWARESAEYNRQVAGFRGRGWYSSVIDGQAVWICQKGGREGPILFVTTADDVVGMKNKLQWQFRLASEDVDVGDVYEDLTAGDPKMGALVYQYRGLRLMRIDPWECLVYFIMAVRTSAEKTQQMVDDIARAFAEAPCLPNVRYPFPSPEAVASDSELTTLNESVSGLQGGKEYLETIARYVYEAAWAAQGLGVWHPEARLRKGTNPDDYRYPPAGDNNKLTLHSLERGWGLSETLRFLRMIPGVGARTANKVALFGLGHPNAFPVDAEVLGILRSLYLDHPYAGYASQFLLVEGRHSRLRGDRPRTQRDRTLYINRTTHRPIDRTRHLRFD